VAALAGLLVWVVEHMIGEALTELHMEIAKAYCAAREVYTLELDEMNRRLIPLGYALPNTRELHRILAKSRSRGNRESVV
jgi:hypothetical protein